MTSTTTVPSALDTTDDASGPLRRVLRANAAFSAVSGVVLAGFGDAVADLLGVDQVGLVRLVGLGLLIFAVDVVIVSRWCGSRLRAGAATVTAADLAWVVATVPVVALGVFEPAGAIAAVLVAAVVGEFAWLQWRARARMAAGAA